MNSYLCYHKTLVGERADWHVIGCDVDRAAAWHRGIRREALDVTGAAICYAAETAGSGETTVAAERPTRAKAGKGTPKRGAAADAETTRPPTPGRQMVDFDPWAVLLEQLMEMPEEEPAGRKPTKGK